MPNNEEFVQCGWGGKDWYVHQTWSLNKMSFKVLHQACHGVNAGSGLHWPPSSSHLDCLPQLMGIPQLDYDKEVTWFAM